MAEVSGDGKRSRRDIALDKMVAQWSSVGWPEVATFIGPNAARFQKAYEKTRADALNRRSGMVWSFSWPALLFSFAWFFARRQWLVGGLLLAVPIVGAYFLRSASFGGMFVVIAMMAKWMYLQASVPKVAKIVEAHPPGEARDAALKAAGGISKAGAIIGGLILAAAVALAFWVSYNNSHSQS